MSDRIFVTSAGQQIVVPSDEPDTLEVLKDYARRNGLGLEEVTPQRQQQASGNPLNTILNVGASSVINRGADNLISSILGSGGSSAATSPAAIDTALSIPGSFNTALNSAPAGFNIAGEIPAGLTYEGGMTGVNAGVTPGTGLFSAPYAVPAGAAGLYGLSRMEKLRYGGAKGAGLGAASGAATGYSIAGPPGAIVGAILGGARGFFRGPSRTKKEQKDREKLAKMGIVVDNAGVKEWELNEKFKDSRDEGTLTGGDIKNAASLYLRYGKDYSNLSNSQRAAIAQLALDRKLVREHKGRIDIAYDDEFDKAARALMVAKPQSQRNNRGTRKASPDRESTPTQNAPAPQEPGRVIPGPAVTVDAGGPSPYQPQLITPQDYAAKYREMLAQRGYQGL